VNMKNREKFVETAVSIWLLLSFVLLVVAFFSSQNFMHNLVLVLALVSTILAGILIAWQKYRTAILYNQRGAIAFGVLESSTSARMIAGEGGRSVYANALCRDLLRGAGCDVSLKGVFAFFSDADPGHEVLGRLATEAPYRRVPPVEMAVHRDGKTSWYLVSAVAVSGWDGHLNWRIQDITAAHEIEEVVRSEREKLVDMMDNAPVGFFSVGADGHFLFVNLTFAGWLGYEAQDMLARRMKLADVLVSLPPGGEPHDIVDGGGDHQIGDVGLRRGDGEIFSASITHTLVRDASGQMLRTRSVVRDLSAERRWKKALRQSELRFQRYFDDAPAGIAAIDLDETITECNRALARIWGRSVGEIVGQKVTSVFPDENMPELRRWLEEAGEDAFACAPMEIKVRKTPGDEAVVQLFAKKRILEDVERHSETILWAMDVTEQDRLENQVVQSQKMQAVGLLAGGIAHDFNNLLTAMIGFCDLLMLRHKPGDSSFADLMQIKQNANRAANLVRQLLAFSRQQTLQTRVLSVTDVLADFVHLLRRLIGEHIELAIEHGRDIGLVRCDPGQLEQVLINLVVNARDAMPENGGRITIRTFNLANEMTLLRNGEEIPSGRWVCLEVSDTGVGIPQENLVRIFEPFFTTKQQGAGTGLGLATVYGIVRQTGGYVTVHSEVDHGTFFTILLPEYSGPAELPVPLVSDGKALDLTGTGRILVVEDEDPVRAFTARALRSKGYEVHEAENGVCALDMVEGGLGHIDLLITDVVMPMMDGPTLIARLRQIQPDVRIICMTGYAEEKFRSHPDMGRGVVLLQKPFTLKGLAEKVKEVLSGKA